MVKRITITLTDEDGAKVESRAAREMRPEAQMAAVLLLRGLNVEESTGVRKPQRSED